MLQYMRVHDGGMHLNSLRLRDRIAAEIYVHARAWPPEIFQTRFVWSGRVRVCIFGSGLRVVFVFRVSYMLHDFALVYTSPQLY